MYKSYKAELSLFTLISITRSIEITCWVWTAVMSFYYAPGADPESLKVGCTKFSGPELSYSGFDPLFDSLVVVSL